MLRRLQIGLAVVSTTAAIVAVFVPVSFMSGVAGQYFSQFGLTVAFSVMFSLLVARLITPLLAAYFLRPPKHEKTVKDGWVMRSYMWVVALTLKIRYLTLIVAFGLFGVSLYYLMQIPGTFIPADDVSRISLNVELPPGSTLADTNAKTTELQQIISQIEGVSGVLVQGGASITGTRDIRRAGIVVILDHLDVSLGRKLMEVGQPIPVIGKFLPYKAPSGRVVSQGEVEAEILRSIQNVADVRVFKLNDRGARDISYSILSSNEEDLNEGIARLEAALRREPLLMAVSSEGALPRPEVQITPRPEIMSRLGLSTRMISEVVRVATIGDFDSTLAKISLDSRRIPVRVQLSMDIRNDILRIGALKIATATGDIVPLNSVADIELSQGPSIIDRLNRERKATIGANLPLGTPLGVGTARFEAVLAATELPPTVQLAKAGDAEIQAELVTEFSGAMVSALILVLTVLILLFGSISQPFTIIFSLPLAIGGVAVGLILTGYAISMPVLIGILMLMGIVTKNAILLIDFAIEEMRDGVDRVTAIIDAGHKRARPIIMTSFAMAAGMLPSALGAGEGGIFRAPMAIAVIGGQVSRQQSTWWTDLRDPLLSGLVEQGLRNNIDIQLARERINQSMAVVGTTGVSSQFNGRLSGETTRGQHNGAPVASTTSNATLSANYVFDLFGKTRRGAEQARANLQASEFDLSTVRLAILSNIVGAYLNARYFQEALALNRQSIESRRKTVSLVEAQAQFGSASELDIARAQSELETALAISPDLEAGFSSSVMRIALALGEPIEPLLSSMQRGARQPLPTRAGSVGVPADVLHNRPDIRALEQRFASAVAAVGVATADMYPSLELTGVVIGSNNTSWSFGPKLTLPIFNQARLNAQRRIAVSSATTAELEWRKGVLSAVSAVQVAQNQYNADRRRVAALRAVVATNDRILELSRTNYESGAISLINLLDAQRGNTNARLNLAGAVQGLSVSWVELQIAAGYGWEGSAPAEC